MQRWPRLTLPAWRPALWLRGTRRRGEAPGWLAAVVGWAGFWVALHLPGWLGAPPINLAVWTGSLFTDNLGWARVLGTAAEVAAAWMALAVWRQLALPLDWRWLAAAVWVVGGLVILPLYGLLSPWIREGLSLAPGPFMLGLGPLDAAAFLLAAWAFGYGAGRVSRLTLA